jgi:superfamily I DNA/RNA helicase
MSDKTWSPQQNAIFAWFANMVGHLIVRARAGTGKTTTIINALNFIPKGLKVLLCAFNKSIATELTARVPAGSGAEAKTLHAIGFSIVRRYWSNVKVEGKRDERIAREVLGPQAADALVRLVANIASKAKGIAPFGTVADLVDIIYSFELEADDEWVEEGWTPEKLAETALRAMAKSALPDGEVSFDDMIYVPVRNGWVKGSYDVVIVDEAQDMNKAQLILAQKVVKKGGHIVLVGDDRQAIYGFRGADAGGIDRLKAELKATELSLNTTYRCPKSVVALAAAIVPDFNAAPSAPEGKVLSMMLDKAVEAVGPGNFILSRKNAPLASVCMKLLKLGKRARISGRDIGAGLIGLVKKLGKKNSIPAFLERLAAWEAQQIKRLKAAGRESADARVEAVKDQAETLKALAEGMESVGALVSRIEELFTDVPEAPGFIVLSSVHKSKGLESDTVYILEDTLNRKPGRNIEESNIEYVGITRAKSTLVWVTTPKAV